MAGCAKCDAHAEAVARINAEPRRIIMFAAWYELGRPVVAREHEDDLETVWLQMPQDGLQKVQYVYNHRNVSRDGRSGAHYKGSLSGCDWYFMARAADGNLFIGGDQNVTKAEIDARYPGAVLKRGKWTSPANIDRINAEVMSWL